MDAELEAWLLVSQVPSLYARAGRLEKRLGGIESVWAAGKGDLIGAGCSEEAAARIITERLNVDLRVTLEKMDGMGIRAALRSSGEYPARLLRIAHPPHIVFLKGGTPPESEAGVGIVGSRGATVYGRSMAESIAGELAASGVTVVSGLARGIDTAAHLGALKAGGRTTAVLGCGLDIAYPPENRALMERIGEKGLLISEYPPGARPFAGNFPARNRIIAGLSDGVVVVEAAERSGALITADFALEQGKDVFAIPGSARSATSRGTHALVKQGAALVERGSDVLEALGIAPDPAEEPLYEPEERSVLDLLGTEPTHIDEIARRLGDSAKAARILMILQIKGTVAKDHGGMYLRIK
ncbi:MAG: DNA-processing protein DprA [Candidatus Aquicultorales bacterium]